MIGIETACDVSPSSRRREDGCRGHRRCRDVANAGGTPDRNSRDGNAWHVADPPRPEPRHTGRRRIARQLEARPRDDVHALPGNGGPEVNVAVIGPMEERVSIGTIANASRSAIAIGAGPAGFLQRDA